MMILSKHEEDIITKTMQVLLLHTALILYFYYVSQTHFRSFLDTLYKYTDIPTLKQFV